MQGMNQQLNPMAQQQKLLHEIAQSNQLLQQTQMMQNTTGTPIGHINQGPQSMPPGLNQFEQPVQQSTQNEEIELSDIKPEPQVDKPMQAPAPEPVASNACNMSDPNNNMVCNLEAVRQKKSVKNIQPQITTEQFNKKDMLKGLAHGFIRPAILLVILVAFMHPSTARYINKYISSDFSLKSVAIRSATIVAIYTIASMCLTYYNY